MGKFHQSIITKVKFQLEVNSTKRITIWNEQKHDRLHVYVKRLFDKHLERSGDQLQYKSNVRL